MKVNVRSQEKSSRSGETGRYNTATIADFNGNISLKNISPRREGEIKNLSQQREEISKASDGGANVVPSSTNSNSYVGGAPVSAGRSSDGASVTQEAQNVDGDGNRASAAQLAEYDQNNTCVIALIRVHCSYSPLSKDCINI